MIDSNSSRVIQRRSGELRCTNDSDLDVRLDPLKCTSMGDYISALIGCCALKFFTRATDWPSLASANPKGYGVPQKILIVKI